jgi:8-oxo-dGTP pyrophosphatase MutT (NUDIX family)
MPRKNGPWVIKGRVLKHRDRFIEVSEDQVVRPNGEEGSYATVRVIRGVCTLPLDGDGVVYLTRQFRYAVERESVEVVGGGVDAGEEVAAAARRELQEELGLTADEWIDLGEISMDTGIIKGPVNLFLARGLHAAQPARDENEHIETVRIPFAEAVRLVMDGEIIHGASCVLILKAHLFLLNSGEKRVAKINVV